MADYHPSDIYKDYQENVENPIDETVMKQLCEDFNERITDKMIYEGRPFEMGSFLSAIQIVKKKRDFGKKVVNWKKSNALKKKLKEEGKELYDDETGKGHKWLVYYTDPFYIRFYWSKWFCRVPNKSAYKFTPSRGKTGSKTKLKDFLNKDDLNHKTYKLIE